ncbi:MAG: hypothetical protein ACO3JG_09265, partial [Luteolibacter sp.]
MSTQEDAKHGQHGKLKEEIFVNEEEQRDGNEPADKETDEAPDQGPQHPLDLERVHHLETGNGWRCVRALEQGHDLVRQANGSLGSRQHLAEEAADGGAAESQQRDLEQVLLFEHEQQNDTDNPPQAKADEPSDDAAQQLAGVERVFQSQCAQRRLICRVRKHIKQVVGDGQQAFAFPSLEDGITYTGCDDPGFRRTYRQVSVLHLDESGGGGGEEAQNAGFADRSHVREAGNEMPGGFDRGLHGLKSASGEEAVALVERIDHPPLIEWGACVQFQNQTLDAQEIHPPRLAARQKVEIREIESGGGNQDDRLFDKSP